MKITPIEIRQKTFEKAFRGYDKEEVHGFLLALSQEWERMANDLRENKVKLEMMDKELLQLREVESSLFKTLKTAEDTSSNMVEQAKKSAELKVKEAQLQAEEILKDARNQAKNLLQKAELKARSTLEQLVSELKNMERDYKTLEAFRDNLLSEIRNLGSSLLDKANRGEQQKTNLQDFVTKLRETQELLSENYKNAEPEEIKLTNNNKTLIVNNEESHTKGNNLASFFDEI